MKTNPRSFGLKLSRLRKAQGWSLGDLAGRLGLESRSYVQHWESGRNLPSAPNAIKLAKVFKTTVEKLFSTNSREGTD